MNLSDESVSTRSLVSSVRRISDGVLQVTESADILDILLHPRLPPLVRPLPPMENISLSRAEESEVEQELRTMLGLVTSEDPEPTASAQSPPQASSKELEKSAQPVEPTSLSRSLPDPAPSILNPSRRDARSPNDMQVDQTNITSVSTLPPDRTPVKESSPLSNPTPSTSKLSERPPPVSEPQTSSWNPIGFVCEEDEEEEEEIPSINMDSDSD